ncbi:MAG: sensor histidine kinase [Ktedonobacterales bacterium]
MRSAHDTGDTPTRRATTPADLPPALLWIIWLLWLFFLYQPLSILLALPSSPRKVIDLGGMALFLGLYLWATWQNAWRLSRETPAPAGPFWRAWGPILALLLVAVTLALVAGQSALGGLIYVSAALCGRLDGRRIVYAIIGMPLLVTLLGVISGAPPDAILQIVFIVPAVGLFVFFLDRAIRANQELRRARQEIARLAVSEERLRFARDLHDLLGHTLSLITLKSELARRLISVAPEQAASEIGDIETAARQALVEVREAVSGYRQPTLQSELSGAQELLEAAGIGYHEHGEPPALAAGAEAAFSWAVREGVTNVIRHSRARSCSITFAQGEGRCSVEIRDDGAAAPPDMPMTTDGAAETRRGAGLAGLKERVAALGGSCQAGAAEGGGWRLLVALPLTAAAPGATAARTGDEPEDERQAGEQTETGTRTEKRMAPWFG